MPTVVRTDSDGGAHPTAELALSTARKQGVAARVAAGDVVGVGSESGRGSI